MHIPLIDLEPLRSGGPSARAAVVAEVRAACEETGFLVVGGHGVGRGTVQRLDQQARLFFDLPLDEKLAVRRPRNDQNRGYIPYGEETLARMHGCDTPADFKEVFAIGPFDLPDDPYYSAPDAYPSFAPNLWPPGSPGLRSAMIDYWREMEVLMRCLARAFALALDLPEDFFEDKLDKHTSQLRLLHYPVPTGELAAEQLRCGEHTDLGMMTILRNEARPGGLQVRTRDGGWIDAPAQPDTFIVNLGDLMMRWSNDTWVSTPHRVAVPSAEQRARSRRLAIGFFAGPNYDAVIDCIESCHGPDRPAKYAPITSHGYRSDRFAAGAGPNQVA